MSVFATTKTGFHRFIKETGGLVGSEPTLSTLFSDLMFAINRMRSVCKNGGTIWLAGNGGSALDANHLACELVGEHRKGMVQRRAVSLAASPDLILAIGNDIGFNQVFAHQLKVQARPGDVFLGISTSGMSENILRAFRVAKRLKVHTIGLLGEDGGKAKELTDIPIIVPLSGAEAVQNIHRPLYHLMWNALVLPDSAG